MTTQEVQEGKKSREPGWYWVTAWQDRKIAEWDGESWWITKADDTVGEHYITDINEKKIVEDGV